ncbi:MAG TPA: GNAT family N-acetyltransferase [Acidimicrobiales bacterium]|nr:GNAT family N-acetyltransferase [Acidimicrobiales bacterium]
MDEVLGAAVASLLGYLRLGNEVIATDLATFVRNPSWSRVTDANHGSAVRAETETDFDRLLGQAEEILGASAHRAFKVTPGTPPAFEARLLLEGYRFSTDLEMILDGPLRAAPPAVEIRPVVSDSDWDGIRELKRADLAEGLSVGGHRSAEVSTQMYESKRAKSPDLTYFLARAEGKDCAFFSSWPGQNGTGVVEDLFTLPDYRCRGLATALICHAVADARSRGADRILIGADPDETPKHLYASLGFRPLLLLRSYWRDVPPAVEASPTNALSTPARRR